MAALLAGCGQAASQTKTTTSTKSTATSGGGVTGTKNSASAPSTAQFPAVAHAADTKVAPVIGIGHQPAPSTLQIRNLVTGTGATATASSTVTVNYTGTSYTSGKIFDSSWSRGTPATFPLNGVIPGFKDAIVGMKVGGRREVVIPPSLGYGSQGSPPAIAPNETLVFVIDLLKVH